MAARSAHPVEVRLATPTSPIPLRKLRIRSRVPVLAVVGTTKDDEIDPALATALLPALRAAVAAAAHDGAAIVTGGTDAGVLHLLGLALASSSATPKAVVGVAPDALLTRADQGDGEARPEPAVAGAGASAASGEPAASVPDQSVAAAPATTPPAGGSAAAPAPAGSDDRAPIDPQLTAILRVPGSSWGDETPVLSQVVADMAGKQPAVVLLAGGGDGSRAELVEHLRRGRPVVVLAGSGRLADEVANGTAAGDDADLAALLADGKVHVVGLSEAAAVLQPLLAELLERRPGRRGLRDRVAMLSVLPRFRLPPVRQRSPIPPTARTRYTDDLRARIDAADRLVVPAFTSCDREAGAEQNRHRWFTVLAILGGLLTTLAGAAQAWLQSVAWPSVVVATLGAATSALITVSRRQDSLRRYLLARIRAERLRSLYFVFLAKENWPPGTTPAQQGQWLEEEVAVCERGAVTL